MQASSVLARDDTFFGICEALGEDFRFNPIFLRLAFAGLLFWNPLAAVGAYAAAGVVVGVSRWFVPGPGLIETEYEAAEPEALEAGQVEAQQEMELAIAA
jgi:phage shock protein C